MTIHPLPQNQTEAYRSGEGLSERELAWNLVSRYVYNERLLVYLLILTRENTPVTNRNDLMPEMRRLTHLTDDEATISEITDLFDPKEGTGIFATERYNGEITDIRIISEQARQLTRAFTGLMLYGVYSLALEQTGLTLPMIWGRDYEGERYSTGRFPNIRYGILLYLLHAMRGGYKPDISKLNSVLGYDTGTIRRALTYMDRNGVLRYEAKGAGTFSLICPEDTYDFGPHYADILAIARERGFRSGFNLSQILDRLAAKGIEMKKKTVHQSLVRLARRGVLAYSPSQTVLAPGKYTDDVHEAFFVSLMPFLQLDPSIIALGLEHAEFFERHPQCLAFIFHQTPQMRSAMFGTLDDSE